MGNIQTAANGPAAHRADTLATATDAVATHRALAAQHPEASNLDLALALLALANCLEACDRMPEALTATAEALGLLARQTSADPDRYSAQVAQSSRDYIERCERAGQAPDMKLLAEITVAFQAFQDARDDKPA